MICWFGGAILLANSMPTLTKYSLNLLTISFLSVIKLPLSTNASG